jgi:hypothetical protein
MSIIGNQLNHSVLQSVRPFFRVPGVPLSEPILKKEQKEQKENEGSSSDPVSSEGFTSFFTTTHTGSSNDNTTHSADSSDSNKIHPDPKDKDNTHVSEQIKQKRKEEGGGDSSGSSQKRVRIIETARSPKASRDDAGNGAEPSDPEQIIERARYLAARANDSTTSSSSNSEGNRQVPHTLSRLVTDISSSNRTDSAAGTSESAGNTGSASNQGSSGSGADGKGSSEEGKGSSEDNGKSRGDDAGGSDETPFGEKPYNSTLKAKIESGHNQKIQSPQGDELREKLIHKKRKRIEMRREYEAQQHFESSESSGYNSESLFRPGKHIQMDQVLQVSNIPR